jgi:hypothetical protein
MAAEKKTKLSCTIAVSQTEVSLGGSVLAQLAAVGEAIKFSQINGAEVKPGDDITFTPPKAGTFELNGFVQDSKSTTRCSKIITVTGTDTTEEVPPSCALNASRPTPTSTQCDLILSSTGGQINSAPTVTGGQILSQNGSAWAGVVNCDPAGQNITATVSNSSGSSQCSAAIPEMAKPQCSISLDQQSITLGGAVNATLRSLGGPITNSTINGVGVSIDGGQSFTPPVAGKFVLNGSVQNPRSTESCSATVTVNNPPVTPQVFPPACALTASRPTPASTQCNVTLSLTGGSPITGAPTVNGGQVLSQNGSGWAGVVNCDPVGQTITATVSNSGGTNQCNAAVQEIAKPQCSISLDQQSITLGGTVNATLRSLGGPVTNATINGLGVAVDRPLAFKPGAAGTFVLTGIAQNPRSTESCMTTILVKNLCNVSNKVGIWGRNCGHDWCSQTETYGGNWIQLPNDATNINFRASTGIVDDQDPKIWINGGLFYQSNATIGNIAINKNINNLRAGPNNVKVSAWNKHTFFSVFFSVTGTYEAASCTHQIAWCKNASGTAGSTCRWVNNHP